MRARSEPTAGPIDEGARVEQGRHRLEQLGADRLVHAVEVDERDLDPAGEGGLVHPAETYPNGYWSRHQVVES